MMPLAVVQVLVRLVVPPGRVDDILHALQAVMRPVQQARGCGFAQICQRANDPRRLEYVEEWDDLRELCAQFGSERFHRLLELLEMAAVRPVLEFRVISETHGLEYIATQLAKKEVDAT
jgi:quinol monooxygenase YgiN